MIANIPKSLPADSDTDDANIAEWSVTLHDETLSTRYTIVWTFELQALPSDVVQQCNFNHIVSFPVLSALQVCFE